MRKFYHILTFMLLSLSVAMTGCSDDPEEIPENGETSEGVEPLPTVDRDEVKGIGTLYYFSRADDATDQENLYDNFVARYASRVKWDGEPLKRGDILYLHGSDIEKAPADVLKESFDNGVVVVADALDSYETFSGFCKSMDVYNPLGDMDLDVQHTMFIVADADGAISRDGSDNYRGVFFALNADSEEAECGTVNDYQQGEIVNDALEALNEILSGTTRSTLTRGMDDDMQRLIGAYKVYLNHSQSRKKSDYTHEKKSEARDWQTNNYSVEYDVWNVFSLSEKRNYYYIHQEVLCSFAACYKGAYKCSFTTNKIFKTVGYVCEWYGDNVNIVTKPDKTSGMQIHRNSPETTTGATTYESGFTWNLGGEIGFIGADPTGSINRGISLSSSESYTLQDITVSNNCDPGNKLEWNFKFAPAKVKVASIKEGALVGRTSFTGGTDYIISFPERSGQPKLECELKVSLKRTCMKAGQSCRAGSFSNSNTIRIQLPYLTSDDFKKQQ